MIVSTMIAIPQPSRRCRGRTPGPPRRRRSAAGGCSRRRRSRPGIVAAVRPHLRLDSAAMALRELRLLSVVAPLLNEEERGPRVPRADQRGALPVSTSSSCWSTTARPTAPPRVLDELAGRRPAGAAWCACRATSATRRPSTAGLDHAAGDVVVMIDADLQDPPELIPAADRALARGRRRGLRRARDERAGRDAGLSSPPRAGSTRLFGRLAADRPRRRNAGDFRLLDRAPSTRCWPCASAPASCAG